MRRTSMNEENVICLRCCASCTFLGVQSFFDYYYWVLCSTVITAQITMKLLDDTPGALLDDYARSIRGATLKCEETANSVHI